MLDEIDNEHISLWTKPRFTLARQLPDEEKRLFNPQNQYMTQVRFILESRSQIETYERLG